MYLLMSKVFVIILFCLLLAYAAVGQTSRALLVAIDNYPASGGWSEIHATNDISIVAPLLKASGYRSNHITILKNEKATYKNIIASLSNLTTLAGKGDYIYLQFSCHGQQMLDDNGDEPDGYDEAVIPYDAQRRYTKGVYEGENHLRDDQLSLFLNQIRLKIGPSGNLLVVFDACHSGSADRNGNEDSYVRGTTYIFGPYGFTPPIINPSKVIYAPKSDKNMATLTVLSACQPNEVNYEYKAPNGNYYGTLSYALCSARYKSDTEIKISDFFHNLTNRMQEISKDKKRKQNPNLQSTNENKTFGFGR